MPIPERLAHATANAAFIAVAAVLVVTLELGEVIADQQARRAQRRRRPTRRVALMINALHYGGRGLGAASRFLIPRPGR